MLRYAPQQRHLSASRPIPIPAAVLPTAIIPARSFRPFRLPGRCRQCRALLGQEPVLDVGR